MSLAKNSRLWIILVLVIFFGLLAAIIFSAPKAPVARLRVIDPTGRPIIGAAVKATGLRTKSSIYSADCYGWDDRTSDPLVKTDSDGWVSLHYPLYVFDRIETGTVCLDVDHPDFVPESCERVVSTSLPFGTPLLVRLNDLWNRLQHKTLIAHPDPITLKTGSTLTVIARTNDIPFSTSTRLLTQISDWWNDKQTYWTHPASNIMTTRRIVSGSHILRAVLIQPDNSVWYSPTTNFTVVIDQTNELQLTFQPGVTVHGQLDESVPRPVQNGRVIAQVWPSGFKPKDSPPTWHTWTNIATNGTFTLPSLPEGDLEIFALCQGFISTNGPGTTGMHYPQKHVLGSNGLSVIIGMQPTTRLEVKVTDNHDQPLAGVTLQTWPNIRYGDWSATILASDCYNTSETFSETGFQRFDASVPDLDATSDTRGLAIFSNLPVEVDQLATDHLTFEVPPTASSSGRKDHYASVHLLPDQTNYLTLKLQPKGQTLITHY